MLKCSFGCEEPSGTSSESKPGPSARMCIGLRSDALLVRWSAVVCAMCGCPSKLLLPAASAGCLLGIAEDVGDERRPAAAGETGLALPGLGTGSALNIAALAAHIGFFRGFIELLEILDHMREGARSSRDRSSCPAARS